MCKTPESKAGQYLTEEHLMVLPLAELRKLWLELFGTLPPSQIGRWFLLGHITWQRQAVEQGEIPRKTASQLKKLMQQLRDGKDITPANDLIIKSGTKLLREYKGVKHEVIVDTEGYRYNNKIYRSLSQIARDITGTRWNGKTFFGAKS